MLLEEKEFDKTLMVFEAVRAGSRAKIYDVLVSSLDSQRLKKGIDFVRAYPSCIRPMADEEVLTRSKIIVHFGRFLRMIIYITCLLSTWFSSNLNWL